MPEIDAVTDKNMKALKKRMENIGYKKKLCFVPYIFDTYIIVKCGAQVKYQKIDDSMIDDGV